MVNLEQLWQITCHSLLESKFKLRHYPKTQNRTLGIRADTVRFQQTQKADTESRAKPLQPRVTKRMIPSTI